ncbi:MAG: sigma 54-interacting transcriptional regulator [Myxococcaceae bacterium]|nr:sigma 54-interacting transcriptional regulator [Myxococcaceae bacterium]
MPTADRTSAERDLFRALVHASRAPGSAAALTEVLASLVVATDSERCYLELHHPVTGERFVVQRGCSDETEARIRAVTSRGIVAAALASGAELNTSSAQLDPRFNQLESVQRQQLEAVLCLPVSGRPPGVLYLEGRRGQGAYGEAEVALAREVALTVGPVLVQAATFQGPADATLAVRPRLDASAVVGRSAALAQVLERIALAAPLDVTVLLTGEPGTGKTQLARLLHDNSRRRSQPFVELNCAAIQDTLVESELFGTTAGAFTGARTASGKFEAASGGTLFLDEVGELSSSAQAKLLQVLQSRQYYAVGSAKAVTANVRLVAATNARLEDRVASGRFREDLFYRLNVMPIRVPSLRERPDDIGLLVDTLLERIAVDHGLPVLQASPALRAHCQADPWPGNVRQLRNRLETGLICAAGEGSPQIEPRHVDPQLTSASGRLTYHEATRAFQRDFLRRQLDEAEGNVAELARRIDLSRPYLSDLLKSFHLNR